MIISRLNELDKFTSFLPLEISKNYSIITIPSIQYDLKFKYEKRLHLISRMNDIQRLMIFNFFSL